MLKSNRTLQRILFMESEARTLERHRTELELKYKCSLPDTSNVNDKKSYHSLEETLALASQNSKQANRKMLPGKISMALRVCRISPK